VAARGEPADEPASDPGTRHAGARARELTDAALAGDRRALARVLTAVENRTPVAEAALRTLYPRAGKAHLVGITGAPGAGKSTLVSALIAEVRARGRTVGVVAVDPSSPITGGALLGDRVRMQAYAGDRDVFIRSMASRGHAGGLASTSAAAATKLRHALSLRAFVLPKATPPPVALWNRLFNPKKHPRMKDPRSGLKLKLARKD